MKRRDHIFSFVAVAMGALVLAPAQALAWGATGHRIIGELAIRALPTTLPAFIRNEAAVWNIGELAREPDRSKGSGQPHDHDLDPGHYVDVSDDLTIAGGPSLAALPNTREDYEAALEAKGTNEFKTGYLPYSIMDGWQQLVEDFAYWRADAAGEKFAKTPEEKNWFARDRTLREMITTRDLGYWSHFVGDGSQPLHVSVHYDGWGNYPNPKLYSTMRGVHAQFEGAYVRANISDKDVAAAVAPYRPNSEPLEARVGQYLLASQAKVVPLYELEKTGAFAGNNPRGKAFVVERLAAGVGELRDMIVDAWSASANAKIGFPAVSVTDIEAGRVDALGPFYGED